MFPLHVSSTFNVFNVLSADNRNDLISLVSLKAGFHQRQSRTRSRTRSRSRRRKSTYELVKIENPRHEQSYKLDRIAVGRIRTFPFCPILFMTLVAYDLEKTSWKQKRKNQPITRPGIKHCDWFILLLHSDNLVFTRS